MSGDPSPGILVFICAAKVGATLRFLIPFWRGGCSATLKPEQLKTWCQARGLQSLNENFKPLRTPTPTRSGIRTLTKHHKTMADLFENTYPKRSKSDLRKLNPSPKPHKPQFKPLQAFFDSYNPYRPKSQKQ